MFKFTAALFFCLVAVAPSRDALADDYSECRLSCETNYTDCTNESTAPEPEVQQAKLASCAKTLSTCYADCENLKPIEPPTGTENNPNIIRPY